MSERKMLIMLIAAFLFLICLILAAIGSNDGLAEDGEYFILCRPGSRVNVRNKPKKDAPVTAWVEFGQYVRTDGKEKNGYVHVTCLASEEPDGWIYAGYLVEEEPRKREYKAEVWEGDVIARKCIDGKRVCKLKEGRIVTVYAQTNRWAVTNKGYIMCDWLKEVDP